MRRDQGSTVAGTASRTGNRDNLRGFGWTLNERIDLVLIQNDIQNVSTLDNMA